MANTLYGDSLRVPNININRLPNVNRPRRSGRSMEKRFTDRLNPRIKKHSYKFLLVMMLTSLFIVMIPYLIGCRFEVIQSGSMSPAIDTGSLVITRPVNPYSLGIGDVIAYHLPLNPDTLIVHRVAGIDNGTPLSFLTKGDANNSFDSYVLPAKSVVGQVKFHIPWIGYLIGFMQSFPGFLIFLIIPGAIILYLEMNKLWSLLGLKRTAVQKHGKILNTNNLCTGYRQLYRSVSK